MATLEVLVCKNLCPLCASESMCAQADTRSELWYFSSSLKCLYLDNSRSTIEDEVYLSAYLKSTVVLLEEYAAFLPRQRHPRQLK